MKMYLRHIATNTFNNFADYADPEPFPPPDGFEWVEGEPTGLSPYTTIPISTKITEKFQELIANHLGQPYLTTSVMADISKILPAVLLNADNPALLGFALAPIVDLSLPPEMEADRQTILSELQL